MTWLRRDPVTADAPLVDRLRSDGGALTREAAVALETARQLSCAVLLAVIGSRNADHSLELEIRQLLASIGEGLASNKPAGTRAVTGGSY